MTTKTFRWSSGRGRALTVQPILTHLALQVLNTLHLLHLLLLLLLLLSFLGQSNRWGGQTQHRDRHDYPFHHKLSLKKYWCLS